MTKKLTIILVGLALLFYFIFFVKPNITSAYSLKLNEDSDFHKVSDSLNANHVIQCRQIFDIFNMLYRIEKVPAGHYYLKKTMSTFDILRKLKNGKQDPIRWTISTATFVEDVAGSASKKFNFDSASFLRQVYDSITMSTMNYTKDNALTLFLPNTYEFYWNSTPEMVLKKMHQELQKFWTKERLLKASMLGLTPSQVYILASLVQKEYTRKDERSIIASVLINRLKINMPLQVDATCKYATRDFGAKRVGAYHIQFNSPYNTYKEKGLPPGPICMPELSTIDAVLNVEKTEYLYYCADPSLNGYHVFSKTFSEHQSVAATYHKKMNELEIK